MGPADLLVDRERLLVVAPRRALVPGEAHRVAQDLEDLCLLELGTHLPHDGEGGLQVTGGGIRLAAAHVQPAEAVEHPRLVVRVGQRRKGRPGAREVVACLGAVAEPAEGPAKVHPGERLAAAVTELLLDPCRLHEIADRLLRPPETVPPP